MKTCENCGSEVSEQFCRVFFPDNEPIGCRECLSGRELTNGSYVDDDL